jgi:peptide/nickel transport system substrate-binding protein
VDVPTIKARSKDFYVQSIDDYGYYLSCNTAVKALKNQKVRDAIKYAIDKKSAVDLVLKGKGTPVSQLVAATNAYYSKSLDWEFDLNKAKQSLIDAGYPNGLQLTLSTQNTLVLRDLATVMKEQLEAAGFIIKLNVVESPALFALWNAGEAELALGGFGFYNDPSYRSIFLLSSSPTSKRYGYNNPRYDALYKEGLTTTDPDKRKEVYEKLYKLAIDDAGFFMIFSSTSYCAVANRVEGLVYRTSGNSDFTHITLKD